MPDTPTTSSYGKTALIDEVTANTQGYTRKAVTEILEAAFQTIQNRVQSGTRVTIPGFGTWQQTQRQARVGTNPQTRAKMQIPAQTSVRWSPGSDFKNAVAGRSSTNLTAHAKTTSGALSRRVGEKVARGRPKSTT